MWTRFDSLFSPSLSFLASLPPEVVNQIISLSLSDSSPSARSRALVSLSLLCRGAWSSESQYLLHRDVVLTSEEQANLWLSQLGLYPPTSLRVEGPDVSKECVEEVLRTCGGALKELELVGLEGLSERVLSIPTLANLSSLTVRTTFHTEQAEASAHTPLEWALLTTTTAPAALKSLSLRTHYAYNPILPHFSRFAETLTHLSITGAFHPELFQVLPECKKLKSLRYSKAPRNLQEVLEHLPRQLQVLELKVPYEMQVWEVVDRLRTWFKHFQGPEDWKRLKTLHSEEAEKEVLLLKKLKIYLGRKWGEIPPNPLVGTLAVSRRDNECKLAEECKERGIEFEACLG